MKRFPNSVLGEFRNGRFSVTRSNKRFSAIAIDQSHVQLNKKLKGTGGIIGLTQDPVSLMNWSVSGPEVSKLIEDFQVASEADEIDGGCDFFHHDETAKRQSDFVSDVRSMAEVIRLHNNPFLDFGSELISLHGQISEDKDSVFVIMERGREQYNSYVKEVIIEKTKQFHAPMKKMRFFYLKAPKRKRDQPKKISMLRANMSILGQMHIATQSREGDLEEFFAHESQNFPPSLAVNLEKMYHSRKSDVLDCLQKEGNAIQSTDDVRQTPVNYDAVVLDGGALIHSLLPVLFI